MADDWQNQLYFGDNLDVLRRHIADQSVDLIYLDPPFNSDATYNVLFKERNGTASAAQITAFDDSWHWDMPAEWSYREVVEGGGKIADLLAAFRQFLGTNDMMAYITMMAIRLKELHRVLKPTGSLYLHCDPTASHYLKVVLDALFAPRSFRNEVIWKRSYGHGDSRRSMGRSHDSILYYTKSASYTLNRFYHLHDPSYLETMFRHHDERGRYKHENLNSPSPRPNLVYEYKGYPAPAYGWRVSREVMERLDAEGRLYFPPSPRGRIKRRVYLHELEGQPMTDVWTDIKPISAPDHERLGYRTQKPEALLERIVAASSDEGDLVLDPFCGCGTTLAVAERLHRRWIGIDITHLAITLMKNRLREAFGEQLGRYEVHGEPRDVASALALAQQDRHQFQYWALGLIDARPDRDQKKGADKGIDGVIHFFDDDSGEAKRVVISVKSGHVSVSHIRDLKGVIEREKAQIAALITLEPATRPMLEEAAAAGFYDPPGLLPPVPKLQILTIEQVLAGRELDYPQVKVTTFQKAPRQQKAKRRKPDTPEPPDTLLPAP